MIRNYNLFTEGVRDMMTPKPNSEIYKSIKKYLDRLQTPLSYYDDQNKIYNKITKLFGVSSNELFVMDRYNLVDSDYNALHNFFRSIVNDQESVQYRVETKGRYLGRWVCYPEQKLARWATMDINEKPKWIVCKSYFQNDINESVRDKMTPKSEEELDQIMSRMTPREMFLKSFSITIDNIHPTKRPLYPRAMKFMKPFKDVRIGDLLTVSPYPGNRDLPLYPIKEKITFKNKEEYLEYKKDNPKVVIADQALDMLFNFGKESDSQNAVVVYMGVDLIFPYGKMWTGVFPYTKEELDTLRSTPLPSRQNNNPNPLNIFNDTFESVRDKMTPKSEEDIIKGFMTADAEDLLKSSFDNKSMMGIKYVLDNYRLYGKETRFIISTKIPKVDNKEDMTYLLNNEQIIKFLNPEQIYVLEKYVLGLHQNEMRYYEKALLKQLDITNYYQSKDNPDIMIGKNKKGDKNYFNYNTKTHLLTYHLDNFSSWLMGELDDDDNHESHRADKNRNDDGLGWHYDDLIMMGIIGKQYDIEIDKVDGSRNDGHSFVKE